VIKNLELVQQVQQGQVNINWTDKAEVTKFMDFFISRYISQTFVSDNEIVLILNILDNNLAQLLPHADTNRLLHVVENFLMPKFDHANKDVRKSVVLCLAELKNIMNSAIGSGDYDRIAYDKLYTAIDANLSEGRIKLIDIYMQRKIIEKAQDTKVSSLPTKIENQTEN
jgi:hypothetical protein